MRGVNAVPEEETTFQKLAHEMGIYFFMNKVKAWSGRKSKDSVRK